MMITIDRAVVEQALEVLEHIQRCIGVGSATIRWDSSTWNQSDAAVTALRAALAQEKAEPNPSRCPQCGGPADNGHDRQLPPNPYWCTRCVANARDDWK